MSSIPKDKLYLIYPETDGQPMAENTLQFEWIVLIKLGLEACFVDRNDVFIAGDLFWYPVEGKPEIRLAPDVLVALGRPKGHRGSYMQWLENHIPPQVVFEILSPGNRAREMTRKFGFYQRYGVQEYYIYDPDKNRLEGYRRRDDKLVEISQEGLKDWTSPLLGIHLEWTPDTLLLYQPDGKRFLSYLELLEAGEEAEQRAENAEQRVENAQERAENAEQRAENAEQRAERLARRLKELGIDPEEI